MIVVALHVERLYKAETLKFNVIIVSLRDFISTLCFSSIIILNHRLLPVSNSTGTMWIQYFQFRSNVQLTL